MVYKIFEGDGPSPTPLDQGPTRSLGSLAREWTTTGLRPAKLSYKATTDPWPAAQNLNYHPDMECVMCSATGSAISKRTSCAKCGYGQKHQTF